jgi:hypothetical protein
LGERNCFPLSKSEANGKSQKQKLRPTVQSNHLLKKKKLNSKEDYIMEIEEKQIKRYLC